MNTITTKGHTQIYYKDWGRGQPVVFSHGWPVQRMVQAGAIPMTWLQVMLEWQRDWARTDTYDAVTGIAKEPGGAYGLGIIYAKTMLGEHASEAGDTKI